MYDSAFTPLGPTVTVGTTDAVQAPTSGGTQSTSYRIRNLGSAAAYIEWYPNPANGKMPTIQVVAPAIGAPQSNTIGMLATSVEVFCLPSGCWFQGSAGTFEVTPGEGI